MLNMCIYDTTMHYTSSSRMKYLTVERLAVNSNRLISSCERLLLILFLFGAVLTHLKILISADLRT